MAPFLLRILKQLRDWVGTAHGGVAGVVLVFAAFAAFHSIIAEPLKPADEVAHAAYALRIAEGRLPDATEPLPYEVFKVRPRRKNDIMRAAKHPPLYYALVAAPVSMGVTGGKIAKGIYFARTITMLITAVGLIYVYALVRLVVPQRPAVAVAASAYIALMPGFVNVSSLVHNDCMGFVTAVGLMHAGLSVLLLGPTGKRIALTSAWAVAGALSRLPGLLLLAPCLLCIALGSLLHARERKLRDWMRAAGWATIVLVAVLAAAGWFYARNYLAQGDVTGTQELLTRFRKPRGSAAEFISNGDLWLSLFDQLWVRFGVGVTLGKGLSVVGRSLLALGVVGVVASGLRWLWTKRTRPNAYQAITALTMALAAVVVVVPIFIYYSRGGGLHARYIYPILWMPAFVVAAGLSTLRSSVPALAGIAAAFMTSMLAVELYAARLIGSRSSDLALLVAIERVGIENPVWLYLPLLVTLATGIALVLRAIQRLHVAG